MSEFVLLSLKVYLLAIVISMAVAVMIKLIVLAVSAGRPPRIEAVVPTSLPATSSVPTGEHVAAITAAINAAMSAHRIVHIEERNHGRSWAVEGRTAHHTSHNVPHRPPHR